MTGQRLLHYEIEEKLGEGGMGVVYKALDTTLGRMVALKLLPARFVQDQERIERFRREARAIAALNHNNIAAIYGLEEAESGSFLVMELAEGEPLSRRIAAGRIPWREALEIAKQIAEGLAEAHDKGILHRDLKPGNIMISDEGRVKIIDFGLAKLFGTRTPGSGSADSPTATETLSQAGVVVGTIAYMSPEQARGRPVGRETDVWALGCVLFEMLSGERAFQGQTTTDTLARILEGSPQWGALPVETPPALRHLLERLLQQDARERLHDIGDVRLAIVEILGGQTTELRAPRLLAATHAAALVVAGLAIGAWIGVLWLERTDQPTARPILTEINLEHSPAIAFEGRAVITGSDSPLIALSPDGMTVVYVGSEGDRTRLFQRRLDDPAVRPAGGTEGAIYPFFSPDGKSLGFLTNYSVKSVPLSGGEPITLCNADRPLLATWTTDGHIYFNEKEGRSVSRVPERGGKPEMVMQPQSECVYGNALPDGKHLLASCPAAGISRDHAGISVIPFNGGPAKQLVSNGYDGRFVEPGYLVFGRAGDLFGVAFDPVRLTVQGQPWRIASGVRMHALFPAIQAGISNNGVIAYAPGGDAGRGAPAWVDFNGKTEFTNLEERVYGSFSYSSESRRLAIQVADVVDYVLVHDFAGGRQRILRDAVSLGYPSITPKGDALAYVRGNASAGFELLYQRLDDGGPPKVLRKSAERLAPSSWAADGKQLAGYEFPSGKMFVLGLEPDGTVTERIELPFEGVIPALSPDGNWVATASLGTSLTLHSVRGSQEHIVLSRAIKEVQWCRQTSQLFHREGNRWFSTFIRFQPRVEWDQPAPVVETEFVDSPGVSYAVSADGKRLLVVKRVREMPRNRIVILQNWAAAGDRRGSS